jgi:hypothetical protein
MAVIKYAMSTIRAYLNLYSFFQSRRMAALVCGANLFGAIRYVNLRSSFNVTQICLYQFVLYDISVLHSIRISVFVAWLYESVLMIPTLIHTRFLHHSRAEAMAMRIFLLLSG